MLLAVLSSFASVPQDRSPLSNRRDSTVFQLRGGMIRHAMRATRVPVCSAAAQQRCALVAMVGDSPGQDDDPGNSELNIDVGAIVREEMASLTLLDPEEQEAQLATFLQRVEDRAVKEVESGSPVGEASDDDGYQFGDITKTVLEATRGEVQRQVCELKQ